ncbi:MAG TPA: hypothetical protein PLD37_13430, partial [Usitatibacteraceae bacterium]|nr:hypothetical protein [Usitatibacteraceae bacterium]
AREYKHRLVLDLYPEKPKDPLLALVRPDPIGEIAQAPVLETPPETKAPAVAEKPAAEGKPAVAAVVPLALD